VGKGQAACGLSLVFEAVAGLLALALVVLTAGVTALVDAAVLAGAVTFLPVAAFLAGAAATVAFLVGAAFLAGVAAFAGAAVCLPGATFWGTGAGAAALFLAGTAFFAVAVTFLAGAAFAAGAAFFAGAAAFLAGAATGFAGAIAFLAGVAFLAGAAAFAGAVFLIASGALAAVALGAGAAFFTGAFFAVAIVFSLVEMQRTLYANDWAQSDSCCWACPNTVNRCKQTRCARVFCVGFMKSYESSWWLKLVWNTAERSKNGAAKSESGRPIEVIKLSEGKTVLSRVSIVFSNP